MKWTRYRLRVLTRLLRLSLVISVLCTGLALADFIFIGYNGVTPYSLDETRVSFPPSPVVVDRIRPDAPRLGSGETIVDSGAGQIKTEYITAAPRDALGNTFAVGPWVVNAQLDDTAHFIGTGDVTIKFETVGFGLLPQTDFNNDLEYDTVLTRLLVGNRTHNATAQFANMPLQGYTVPIANVPFLIDLVVEDTFSVSGTLANPDSLSFDFSVGGERGWRSLPEPVRHSAVVLRPAAGSRCQHRRRVLPVRLRGARALKPSIAWNRLCLPSRLRLATEEAECLRLIRFMPHDSVCTDKGGFA